jgi:hypothetical protein
MDGVSFECMEMITSGTEAVAKLALNWARQGQRAAMALMLFATKTLRSVHHIKENLRNYLPVSNTFPCA